MIQAEGMACTTAWSQEGGWLPEEVRLWPWWLECSEPQSEQSEVEESGRARSHGPWAMVRI